MDSSKTLTLDSSNLFLTAQTSFFRQPPPPLSFSAFPAAFPQSKLIPKTHFVVDAFRYAGDHSVSYFLSHFHSDHYIGLSPNWSKGVVFCSQTTAKLLIKVLKVPSQFIVPLVLSEPIMIDECQVVLIDANHCPGVVQFFFKIPGSNGKFKKYVHTGDFRFCDSMKSNPFLCKFVGTNAIFLDTTYCNPKFVFSSQEESIDYIVSIIEKIGGEYDGSMRNVLFLVATYVVGKEKILLEIARKCNRKVPNFVKVKEIMVEKGYTRAVGFVPTGWTYEVKCNNFSVRTKDSFEIHLVPYSEYSNYIELGEPVKFLKPKRFVPTLGLDVEKLDSKHVDKMKKHFARLVDEMANKQEFLKGFHRGCDGVGEMVEKDSGNATSQGLCYYLHYPFLL
ncbi:hypothetical protein FEM48_Zijuj04G0181200 [Ziziphus jujuba var. spinosa]|uniref:DNA repair metallo-beta-lactamase domain-containing protein n=1 Tax=Ziziphus jujuba var. spinosa TaxID=714518 RepID=A0A978VLD7_ZIZJJ|nr:hypothetical protein FEM48_Zijuj04G0181200 [Ziziphus jujuba var. spinosa]